MSGSSSVLHVSFQIDMSLLQVSFHVYLSLSSVLVVHPANVWQQLFFTGLFSEKNVSFISLFSPENQHTSARGLFRTRLHV